MIFLSFLHDSLSMVDGSSRDSHPPAFFTDRGELWVAYLAAILLSHVWISPVTTSLLSALELWEFPPSLASAQAKPGITFHDHSVGSGLDIDLNLF